MKNTIQTIRQDGTCLYEANFRNAETAYAEYKAIINNLKGYLPKGHTITVVRYSDDKIMALEDVTGTR